jgi:hypothetical protein
MKVNLGSRWFFGDVKNRNMEQTTQIVLIEKNRARSQKGNSMNSRTGK